MDMLALRGVPLAVAHNVTETDMGQTAFAAAQRAFEEARGEGTPLLPAPETGDGRGPAQYVRDVITAMLVRHAEGNDPQPIGELEMAAAAEAHMALVEMVAAELSNFDPEVRIPSAPPASPAALPIFGAIEYPRADWLADSILKSLVRIHSVDLPRSTAPTDTDGKSPLLRLAEESAYWRSIPPHGALERGLSEQRSALMGAVKGAPRQRIPEAYASEESVQAVDFDESWIRTEAARMSGILASKVQSEVDELPSLDAVRSGILRKMATKETTPSGQRASIVSRESVDAFLANFDVMRDYVFQPV